MKNITTNKYLYLFSSILIYATLYILISLLLKDFYRPVVGIVTFLLASVLDIFFYKRMVRIYIRLLFIVLIFVIFRALLSIFVDMVSAKDTYNIFDKTGYIFFRDTLISIFFIFFYFIFDGIKLKQQRYIYYISTFILILAFYISLKNLNFDNNVNKTIFKNYFNYGFFLIIITLLFLIRHISFNLEEFNKKINKRDVILLLLLIFPIVIFLFSVVLQKHINDGNKSNSALFNQSLFQFDFSNFVELKDEIKLSEDKVLILELSGVNKSEKKMINDGWDKQIYLKRFSLEEFKNNTFKVAENYIDPESPPVYLSGYEWELKNIPTYKNRVNILETLYLINIDATSLMGSDLLTRVTPMTRWEDSSFKQIYKSYCYTSSITYKDLLNEDLTSDKFVKNLKKERRDILLNYKNSTISKKIRDLAYSVTAQYKDPFYKTLAIQEYFWDNYYYSLKPGFSRNGNQLDHFLFETKKGYCTYFAFSMVLMLRSLGIPSRVAVGFAPDMKNSTLNFYEVRALDGHAWVEVFFDGYGWITFDPTSSNIAQGEDYEFAFGNKDERDKYIEEILKNKDKMQDIKEKDKNKFNFDDVRYKLKNSIRWVGFFIFISFLLLIISVLYIKKVINVFLFTITKESRKKIIYLYRHFMGKLLDLGYPIKKNESITEYAIRIKNISDIEELTKLYQMAIFKERESITLENEKILKIKKEIDNSIKKERFPKRVLAFFNFVRLWKRILPIIFILILSNNNLFSDEKLKYEFYTINEYLDKAKKAVRDSFFDEALALLNEAEVRFPDNYQPNFEKSILYNRYELYENALLEQLKAKKKGLANEAFYEEIATSYGRLQDDYNALKMYEESYEKFLKSKNIYDNLGWNYYKVHNTKRGIEIVKEGLKKYPNSSDLLMTLGTLYSDIWDYDNSKKNYIDSINYSYDDYKSNSFRSISYYNISILEHSFLFYENAFNSSNAAISLKDRSSAHMELSYLYQGKLELKKAYDECKKASRLEPKTLFPEMAMASIDIYSGNIDRGLEAVKDLLQTKDFSWMLYFGTNKDAFYAELYKNLVFGYQSKANSLQFYKKRNLFSFITIPIEKIYYYTLAIFYSFRYANLNIKIGEELIKGGSDLEGLHQLYDGYKAVSSSKAYKILTITEKIETALNPRKQKMFDLEKPPLRKKNELFYFNKDKKNDLLKTIVLLDKEWERASEADALYEVYLSSSANEKARYKYELFTLFPTALPVNGIMMDFKIVFDTTNLDKNQQKRLSNSLRNRGIINSNKSPFTLNIKRDEDKFIINLYNRNNIINSYNIPLNFKKGNNYYEEISLKIFESIFIVNLQ